MKIIFVTHPDPERVDPQGSFRPLSEKGIGDLKLVSEEIYAFLKNSNFTKVAVVSSSAVRCVQTAFEVGNHLRILQINIELENKVLVSDKFIVTDILNEIAFVNGENRKVIPLSQDRLALSLNTGVGVGNEIILLSCHGDFANLISEEIIEEGLDGFFFQNRPVFGILELTKSADGNFKIDLLDCFRIDNTSQKVSLKKS